MQSSYRNNASKLHQAVGECFAHSDFFKHHVIYQEYSVSKVNPNFDGIGYFDWVIPSLSVVIECHGQQHYRPVAFGNDYDQAIAAFKRNQISDKAKRNAAIEAGWTYIVVPYTDIKLISEDYLIKVFLSNLSPIEKVRYNKTQERTKHPKHRELLKKQREYRKQQYRLSKEKRTRG